MASSIITQYNFYRTNFIIIISNIKLGKKDHFLFINYSKNIRNYYLNLNVDIWNKTCGGRKSKRKQQEINGNHSVLRNYKWAWHKTRMVQSIKLIEKKRSLTWQLCRISTLIKDNWEFRRLVLINLKTIIWVKFRITYLDNKKISFKKRKAMNLLMIRAPPLIKTARCLKVNSLIRNIKLSLESGRKLFSRVKLAKLIKIIPTKYLKKNWRKQIIEYKK